jgi:hypothetical protein
LNEEEFEVVSEITHSSLWYPGQELVVPAEVPSPEEFRAHFVEQTWPSRDKQFANLDCSLSALRVTDQPPAGFAFLDIDDMVGELGTSLRQLQYPEDNDPHLRQNHHDYGEHMFFNDDDHGVKYPLIRLVKYSEIGLQPTEHIKEIRDLVAGWRMAGIYVTFITSAIEGAEKAAVDFVGKYFHETCDGIVITSGHYQLADKGVAAVKVVNFASARPGAPAIHIDDLHFNTTKVRPALQTHPANLNVASFQNVIPSKFPLDEQSQHGASTFETFQLANKFFAQNLQREIPYRLPLDTVVSKN